MHHNKVPIHTVKRSVYESSNEELGAQHVFAAATTLQHSVTNAVKKHNQNPAGADANYKRRWWAVTQNFLLSPLFLSWRSFKIQQKSAHEHLNHLTFIVGVIGNQWQSAVSSEISS